MKLPAPPARYTPATENVRNRLLEQADADNLKRGRDIEAGNARIILTASDGSRHALVVAPDGTLSTEPV